jgi:hypothetical protein
MGIRRVARGAAQHSLRSRATGLMRGHHCACDRSIGQPAVLLLVMELTARPVAHHNVSDTITWAPMNLTTFRAALCCAASLSFLPSAAHAAPAKASAPYSLKTVDTNPIPKDEHFLLWEVVAFNQCKASAERHNLTSDACMRHVSARANACAAKFAPGAPAMIASRAASKDLGRKYLDCMTPYYYCNGVEVKTEEEIKAKCK